jgi:hypothetical protein
MYAFCILSFLVTFLLGSFFGNKVRIRLKPFFFNKKHILFFYPFFFFLSYYFIQLNFDGFFNGYLSNIGLSEKKGSFVAFSLLTFGIFFYSMKKKTFFSFFYNPNMAMYWVIAILILSLGGRLYFLTTFLSILIYYSCFIRKIKITSFLILSFLLIILFSIFGLMRTNTNITFIDLLFIFSAEPIFTSFSLITFLSNNEIIFFQLPIFLLSDFINLIPHFLLPDKGNYILNPNNFGFHFTKPIGAQSLFVNLIINFGFFGSVLFLFLIGFSLSLLKKSKNWLFECIYCFCVAHLTFTFFRDSFQVSLVKNIFQFSILVPLCWFAFGRILFILSKKPL